MCALTGKHHRTTDVLGIIAGLRTKPIETDERPCTMYDNHEYMLLGLIIERISGWPYCAFVQEQIFDEDKHIQSELPWLEHVKRS